MKKRISMRLACAMMFTLVSCGGGGGNGSQGTTPPAGSSQPAGSQPAGSQPAGSQPAGSGDTTAEDWHIGIITGTVSQSEDDLRGAEAIQAKYGADKVKLSTYPDNFTEELETTIQTIVNMADDPQMKAIIVNQSVPGTAEAFKQVKELRPDILCIAGEAHEDLPVVGASADLVCNNDFVSRGYLIIQIGRAHV